MKKLQHVEKIFSLSTETESTGLPTHIRQNGSWYSSGSNYCALSLSSEHWNIPESIKACGSSFSPEPVDYILGTTNIDLLRSDVMGWVADIVDLKHFGASYPTQLTNNYSVVRIGGFYVRLSFLDRATRYMLLAGMEWIRIGVCTEQNIVKFIATHNGLPAAIVSCAAINDWEEAKERFPLMGSVFFAPTDAEPKIEEESIPTNIRAIELFDSKAEQDALSTRQVFAVQLIVSKTYYALANTKEEAYKIARRNADIYDFDSDYEVESIEECSKDDIPEEDSLYDKDGEVSDF